MQTIGLQGSPLSPLQARLWLWQKKSREQRMLFSVQVRGPLEQETCKMALERVIEHHEILRTTLYTLPGMDVPVQVVGGADLWSWSEISLERLASPHQSNMFDDLFTDLQKEGYDGLHPAVFHAWLFRCARDRHVLVVSLPALCTDASSNKLFIAELARAYMQEAFTEEVLQYADVAAWQEEVLQGDEAEAERQFWRKIDLSQIHALRLPFEREEHHAERTADTPFVLDNVTISLSENLVQQIELLVQRSHSSISALLLACWQVLLWRLSDESTVVVGIACDGRRYTELANAIGPYHHFVPIDAHFEQERSFRELFVSAHKALQEANERQLYFTWEDGNAPTDSDAAIPFFPVCFEYEDWPAAFHAGEVSFSLLKRWNCTEPFALKLSAVHVGKQLQLDVYADPRRLARDQMRSLAHLLQTLLLQVIEQPQRPIGTLALLTAEEQTHLLTTLKAPVSSLPMRAFHQLFEEQVQRHPHQMSVISAREHLTYQQVNAQANRLAQVLRQRGVGPHVLVGLAMTRSAQMLVGLLAILKAGGAYLPLDPTTPQTRLGYQLEESGAALLLTQREVRAHMPAWAGETACLEEWEPDLAEASAENVPVAYEGEAVAYVIYTSGSTGTPKGVMVRQSSVVNYTLAMCKVLGAEPGWQYATVSTIAADLGNTAIFCALASGGCVQVLNDETITTSAAMAHWTRQHPIDVLKIVPSHLSALLEGEVAKEVLPRRALIIGGEAVPVSLLERVGELEGGCHVYNHYGPTEATIGVLVRPLGVMATAREQIRTWKRVPLGFPISNTEAYILDQRMHLVPMEGIGELYLGGMGLAQGYLKQPEQTAERFVPHPFSQEAGARLYRTGDLVRYREEGRMEFLGRRDGQVKLRGYRIEVGEIEAVLRRHPQVRSAVVLLREDQPMEPRLVCYLVAWQSLSSEEMSEFLRRWLPDFMIPTHYIQRDALPLTANGKVDRQQLLVSRPEAEKASSLVVHPRSPIEEMVATIWKDLLGVLVLSIHDNFFAIGGHSLTATRVVARIQVILQIELPVQMLFEAPTVAEFAYRIEHTLQKHGARTLPPLIASERPEQIPLSYAQQRLWFLDQLEPGSTAYLASRARRMRGILDALCLERSLAEMVGRHESLRTTFVIQAGQLVQVIHPESHLTLPVIDLQRLRQEQKENEAQRLVSQEAHHPCDLAQGPLWRTYLLRLGVQEHVLLLTLHHIITDGWSNEVFVREVATLYEAFASGRPSPLTPLPIQYADYALWQREWLQGEILEAQVTYWQKQLADIPVLDLPTDHPRLPGQTYQGATLSMELPEELLQRLRALSQQEAVTMFMLLLTAFQVLLTRYTGITDISVGTSTANRTRAEIEGVIGFFVNMLVIRTDFSGNPTFQQMLQQVRSVCLAAYTHQDVPFEKLVDILQPERDMSRSPLFQVSFQSTYEIASSQMLPGLSFEVLGDDGASANDDLRVMMTETQQGFSCTAFYNAHLFEAWTICRFLEHFQTLLQEIVLMPEKPVALLPILSEQERYMQIVQWNTTQASYPEDMCIHQLFEQQVQRTPDALALIFEEEALTYSELNRRANHMAHHLQRLGVGPEVLVGICMKRSIEMVAGLLGVLKAGGAYVPLDPTYPQERLAFLREDAQITVLLTQQHVYGQESVLHAQVVLVEHVWKTLQDQPVSLPMSRVSVENLAYVMYTSGSTGIPKGVSVSHASLANLAHAQAATFGSMIQGQRVLQAASFSFDVSIAEVCLALLTGATLLLPGPHRQLIGGDLVDLLTEQGVQIAVLTPSALATIPDALLPTVRLLIATGEACPPELVRWARGRTMVNAYGPTEVTVWASMAFCDNRQTSISIGHPLANMHCYILDPAMQVVPIGVAGELYVGGAGLARGYLGRPDLTAQRFVPHPFSHEEGARLYRTGDQTRYLTDGTIEYLGRIDHQVKLRGYRIELGEIEVTLRAHPLVQDAVVTVREDESGDARLVAYTVLNLPEATSPDVQAPPITERSGKWQELDYEPYRQETSQSIQTFNTAEWIRQYLRERLPAYMLPTHLMVLKTLPLTPNGKIDRHALPLPGALRSNEGKTFEPPKTALEVQLAQMWQDVLHVDQIGTKDLFFALGGDSIKAAIFINRLQDLFGVRLYVVTLFDHPTISSLANYLALKHPDVIKRIFGSDANHMQESNLIRIEPLPREAGQEFPLSFAQQRLWLLDQLTPNSTTYLSSEMLRFRGMLNCRALERSIQEIVSRHENLRTTFVARTEQPVQVIHPMSQFILPIIDLSNLRTEQRAEEANVLAHQESQQPCDLARGPLFRIYLLRLETQEHLMVLSLHHIITDGWSNGVIIRELSALYSSYVAGQPSPLAPLPIQYSDYAQWQRQWLQGKMLQKQLAYWQQQLSGASPVALPTDGTCAAIKHDDGARYSFMLSTDLSAELVSLSRREGVTLFMTLLAAFQILLYHLSGQLDIVVGTDVANRNHRETEGLIGFFINLLALRTNVQGSSSFRSIIQQVRATVLGAYAHQELPFEMVVEQLGLDRNGVQAPLIHVLLVLQNMPQHTLQLSDITIETYERNNPAARFDLALFLHEEPGGIRGTVVYRRDLFNEMTIATWMRRFEVLLGDIVASPEKIVERGEFYTDEEKNKKMNEKAERRELKKRRIKTTKAQGFEIG